MSYFSVCLSIHCLCCCLALPQALPWGQGTSPCFLYLPQPSPTQPFAPWAGICPAASGEACKMLPVLADAACVCQLHVCPMSQSPALFPCEHLPECLVYRVTRKVCVSSPSPPVESGVGTLSHCPSCSETWGKSPFSRVPICALKGLNPKRVFQAVFCGAQKFLSFSSDGVRGGGQIFENHPGQTPSEDWLTSPFRLLWSCIPEPLLQAGGRRQKQELSERGLRCSLTHVKSGLGKAGQFHG